MVPDALDMVFQNGHVLHQRDVAVAQVRERLLDMHGVDDQQSRYVQPCFAESTGTSRPSFAGGSQPGRQGFEEYVLTRCARWVRGWKFPIAAANSLLYTVVCVTSPLVRINL
jgi:hypothetical protein